MRMQEKIPISIDFSFCITAAAFILVLPFRLVMAFVLATMLHELGHLMAIVLSSVDIHFIRVRGTGVEIHTDNMSTGKELICSLSGPICGLMLLTVARYMPCTAVIAFLQSVFNLIPIYPLDGGRALRSLLCKLFGEKNGFRAGESVGIICIALIFAGAIYLAARFGLYYVLAFAVLTVLLKICNRKIPCKQTKQIVQ